VCAGSPLQLSLNGIALVGLVIQDFEQVLADWDLVVVLLLPASTTGFCSSQGGNKVTE
jgi:hypothetical protein